ncbi:MAG TPA: hypothetical protein VN759_11960 [Pseudolysinimonas sp.]|nr:hypothetical protein [Pseudolysinimonas sp.]
MTIPGSPELVRHAGIQGAVADHPHHEEFHVLTPSRPVVIGLAGLGLVGALAGCSTAATPSGSPSSGSSGSGPSTSSAPSTSGPGGGGSASYRDGTYSADGSYQAPSGTETITVKLTLASDKVTAVAITKHATDPNAVQYQTMFANGISSIVVGKDIDSLGVSRVAGSSLTSGGFRAAVDKIKSEAVGS